MKDHFGAFLELRERTIKEGEPMAIPEVSGKIKTVLQVLGDDRRKLGFILESLLLFELGKAK